MYQAYTVLHSAPISCCDEVCFPPRVKVFLVGQTKDPVLVWGEFLGIGAAGKTLL